ncbi:putative N-acetyltransferase YsnE [Thalassocella blandensis]|nr:putative N-acetyltransferase YsnE [Thalassocella blandensis]
MKNKNSNNNREKVSANAVLAPHAVVVKPVDYQDPHLQVLLSASDAYTLSLYPAEVCFLDSAKDLAEHKALVMGAYVQHQLVGIGAGKFLTRNKAELKRIFVMPDRRGSGIASRIIHHLETALQAAGAEKLVLETGIYQPEAIALYTKLGYATCEPYGEFSGQGMNEDEALAYSVFMQKSLMDVTA